MPDSTFSTAGQILFFVTKHFRYQPDSQKSPKSRNLTYFLKQIAHRATHGATGSLLLIVFLLIIFAAK